MIPNLTPGEVKEKLESGSIVLVDVREPHEVEYCCIEGATHIPLRQVRELAPLELAKSDQIVLYCHHGSRSMMAAGALRALGFEHVYNMAGGIDAWASQIDPSLPRY